MSNYFPHWFQGNSTWHTDEPINYNYKSDQHQNKDKNIEMMENQVLASLEG